MVSKSIVPDALYIVLVYYQNYQILLKLSSCQTPLGYKQINLTTLPKALTDERSFS